MKRILLALLLCCSMLLTGCSSLLDRSYLSVTPHARLPVADDTDAIWVETYSELVNAILGLVSDHQEKGTIRLRNWKGDVRQDLTRACDEVSHDDPLGAYAVDRIKPDYTRMVTYYEATVAIDYRRTAEQIASVTSVTGSGAIRGELRDALSGFVTETAFRVNYFDESQGADYFPRLLQKAYYDVPAAALGMPEIAVTLYPDSGRQRVAEITLTYPEDPHVLREKSEAVTAAAQELARPYRTGLRDNALAQALYGALIQDTASRQKASGDSVAAAGSTAYAALVAGSADSEGFALAYKLLCDLSGVECTVVAGSLEGAARYWNIVTIDNLHRHVDPFRPDEGLFLTDAQMSAAGFTWDTAEYPACGETFSETGET